MTNGLVIVGLLLMNFWGLLLWRALEKIHQELPDDHGSDLEGQANQGDNGELNQLAPGD